MRYLYDEFDGTGLISGIVGVVAVIATILGCVFWIWWASLLILLGVGLVVGLIFLILHIKEERGCNQPSQRYQLDYDGDDEDDEEEDDEEEDDDDEY